MREVPPEYMSDWLAASEELSVAAVFKDLDPRRFDAAVAARLALREVIEGGIDD